MKQPPKISQPGRLGRAWLPGAAGMATFLAGLHFFPAITQAIPHCALRTFTGIPCPFCGGTRSMLALSRFDLAGAFRFNPVVGLLPFLLLAWPLLTRFEAMTMSPRWWMLLAAVMLVNWLYLCATLPP